MTTWWKRLYVRWFGPLPDEPPTPALERAPIVWAPFVPASPRVYPRKPYWHVVDAKGMARCNYTYAVDVTQQMATPPDAKLVCGRCLQWVQLDNDGEEQGR